MAKNGVEGEEGKGQDRKQKASGKGTRRKRKNRELDKPEHSRKLQPLVSHQHFCLMSLTLTQTMYTFPPGPTLPLSEELCPQTVRLQRRLMSAMSLLATLPRIDIQSEGEVSKSVPQLL